MTFAVRDEAATIRLGEQPGRASMQIEHLVRGVGDESLFVILFKWPENVSKFEYAEPDQNFLQVTGGKAGLTVEVMSDGRLSTVGHSGGDTRRPAELERQDGTTIAVFANEVLQPDEAVELFTTFLEQESVDTTKWSLRGIPIDDDQSPADQGTQHDSGASLSPSSDTSNAPSTLGGIRQGELRVDPPRRYGEEQRETDSNRPGSSS